MYLVTCRLCRTEFANDARICPCCGHLRNHVAIAIPDAQQRTWPAAEAGESHWRRATRR